MQTIVPAERDSARGNAAGKLRLERETVWRLRLTARIRDWIESDLTVHVDCLPAPTSIYGLMNSVGIEYEVGRLMHEAVDWFERIWQQREQELYPSLFGQESRGIFTIPWERLQAGGITDPRWNTCGVYRFSPTTLRPSWLYVSSGLSNAWFDDAPDPTGVSGFGCEFVLEADEESDWPIQRLHQLMVFQIAICCGRIQEARPFDYFSRIPADSPIDWKNGNLTTVMLAPPVAVPEEFSQESGTARFLGVAAITPT